MALRISDSVSCGRRVNSRILRATVVLLLAAATAGVQPALAQQRARGPNVLVIMADDLNNDMGVFATRW